MKKRLYLACGKTFAKKEEAVAHIFKTYTTTLVRDGMGNVRDANWVSGLRRLEEGKYAPVPYSKNAPESFSLREAMPPVYDQASRGTCAANAGTALVEYYEGCKTRLSVQYLYERMKRAERDAYRIAAEELMSGGHGGGGTRDCRFARSPAIFRRIGFLRGRCRAAIQHAR